MQNVPDREESSLGHLLLALKQYRHVRNNRRVALEILKQSDEEVAKARSRVIECIRDAFATLIP